MTRFQSPRSALVAAVAIALLAASVAAASIPDKSGGSRPVRLTLLNSDDNLAGLPAVQRFIDRVQEHSGGAVTIDVRFQNDGTGMSEQRIVRDVRSNKAQLAWVGTRVWDTLGVESFRALHAPMLIDSYPLQRAVLRSDLPRSMLPSIDKLGLDRPRPPRRQPALCGRQAAGADTRRLQGTAYSRHDIEDASGGDAGARGPVRRIRAGATSEARSSRGAWMHSRST